MQCPEKKRSRVRRLNRRLCGLFGFVLLFLHFVFGRPLVEFLRFFNKDIGMELTRKLFNR